MSTAFLNGEQMNIQPTRDKSALFEHIDIRSYQPTGLFEEHSFRDALATEDWEKFRDKRILIRGCGKGPVPPWAFMLLQAKLGDIPKLIAYGESCAPIVVFKRTGSAEE